MRSQNRFLIAAAVVGFAATVQAQAFNDFGPSDTSFSGWNTDRANPGTFVIGTAPDGSGNNALDMGVQLDANSNQAFYAYEGKQKSAGISGDWTVSGSLYVTADMLSGGSGNYYSTGLWTRDNNPVENNAWYGILQFRETATTPGGGFYYWDGNLGTWDAISASLTGNSWYNLAMSQVGTTMDYYINGNLVASYANASQVGYSGLQTVFLEDYNFGQSTNVYWQNVGAAPGATPEPVQTAALWAGAIPIVFGIVRSRRQS